MAACGVGAPNVKISKLDFCRNRVHISLTQYGMGVWKEQQSSQCAALIISQQLKKSLTVCCGLPSEKSLISSEEKESSSLTSHLIPNSYEVESLLTEICDTSTIADFELKLGGFRLYVLRDLAENVKAETSPSPITATPNLPTVAPHVSGSISSHSLAISKPTTSIEGVHVLLDKATDEGLVILRSPRVGYFRRSRTIKGKRAPPPCKEKQIVKDGQVICYIEQLGGELPIESDISGEVIEIFREDGDPVGYGDALIAILPPPPGI